MASQPVNRCTALTLISALIFPVTAPAGDPGVTLPGLHSIPPDAAAASKAAVRLDSGHIDVSLGLDIRPSPDAALALDMPRFEWQGDSDPFPERQFPDLTIAIDQTPAPIVSSFTAFAGSTDITGILKASGVDPFVIATQPPVIAAWPGSAADLEQLRQLGAVKNSGAALAGQPLLALWSAERHVRVALPARQHATLALSYDARPGGDLLELSATPAIRRLAPYCLDPAMLTLLIDHRRSATVTEFAISVGIDGKSPTSTTVEIGEPSQAERPRALAAFCGPDGKPVLVRTPGSTSAARPDKASVIRILSVWIPPA
jgi:hypothetical protein